MKTLVTLLSIAALAFMTIPVHAEHNSRESGRHDRIEQRLDNQRYRIHRAIDAGELTRKEVKRLRKQQRHIIRLKHKFMRDGYLDRYEFVTLRDELNRASKRIQRLSHNDRNNYKHHYDHKPKYYKRHRTSYEDHQLKNRQQYNNHQRIIDNGHINSYIRLLFTF